MTNELQDIETVMRLHMTRDIVVAAASCGSISDLAAAIKEVHAALVGLGNPEVTEPSELVPAVPIRKSVFPDRIISLETGVAFKSMKRHLSNLGMTPEQYRAKWGLPKDYPIIAKLYSERRSQLAKDNGLGKKR